MIATASVLFALSFQQVNKAQSTGTPVSRYDNRVQHASFIQDDKSNETSELQNALQALRNETNNLKIQIDGNSKRPQKTLRSPQIVPPLRDLQDSQIPLQTDRLSQIRKIQKRIEILRQLSAKNAAAASRVNASNIPPLKNVNSRTDSNPLQGAMDWQNQPPDSLIATPRTTEAGNLTDSSDSTNSNDLTDSAEYTVARVVEGVINRYELGNSLFAAGRIQDALANYEKVKPANLLDDHVLWHLYMTATCHRLLNNIETAESFYRELATRSQGELPVKAARWWLSYLNDKKTILVAIENGQKAADNLLQIAESYVKE